jgi:hypothetical protein
LNKSTARAALPTKSPNFFPPNALASEVLASSIAPVPSPDRVYRKFSDHAAPSIIVGHASPAPLACTVAMAQNRRQGSFYRCDFFGQYRKAVERIRTESRADRDISGVATAGDQHPADARGVVARVKGVPLATEIGFEPG